MDTLMHDDLARLIDVHAGRVLIADALSLLALSPGEARDLADRGAVAPGGRIGGRRVDG
ncbi:MAG: hypothetical protein V9E98_02090 [Candidatus Nanopelagicales bacterium]